MWTKIRIVPTKCVPKKRNDAFLMRFLCVCVCDTSKESLFWGASLQNNTLYWMVTKHRTSNTSLFCIRHTFCFTTVTNQRRTFNSQKIPQSTSRQRVCGVKGKFMCFRMVVNKNREPTDDMKVVRIVHWTDVHFHVLQMPTLFPAWKHLLGLAHLYIKGRRQVRHQ